MHLGFQLQQIEAEAEYVLNADFVSFSYRGHKSTLTLHLKWSRFEASSLINIDFICADD